MADNKFLDLNGLDYYHQKMQQIIGTKLDNTADVSVHGGKFMKVNESTGAIEPSALPVFVKEIQAGSQNVRIGGTAEIPTIAVDALEMPQEFTSPNEPEGAFQELLSGMDSTVLQPIIPGSELSVSDIVLFANNKQAVVIAIDEEEEEYDAIITRVPAEVSFEAIIGDPTDNANLSGALDLKLDVNLGDENAGLYLLIDESGDVIYGEIPTISEPDIDEIMDPEE